MTPLRKRIVETARCCGRVYSRWRGHGLGHDACCTCDKPLDYAWRPVLPKPRAITPILPIPPTRPAKAPASFDYGHPILNEIHAHEPNPRKN